MSRKFICLLLALMLPFVLAATVTVGFTIPTVFVVETEYEDTLHVLVKTNSLNWEVCIEGDVEWRIANSDNEFQSSEIPILIGVAGDHSPGVDFELRGDFDEFTLRWYSLENGEGGEVVICR